MTKQIRICEVEHIFMCLLAIPMSFLEKKKKTSNQVFSPFFDRVFFFLILNYKNCLYFLDVNCC